MTNIRIGLIGDYNPANSKSHTAIPIALELASAPHGYHVDHAWLPTEDLDSDAVQLSEFDALWCVPGSPYINMDGALKAIKYAREEGRTFLGTCGGFQHALIEYARNALGITDAEHAESSPGASMQLIAPLACAMVGVKGTIHLLGGSRIAQIYDRTEIVEEYRCSYGLNPAYRALLENSDLRITAVDDENEVRVVELANHPFFIGTLYQPELSALSGQKHPLIEAYLKAAVEAKEAVASF